MSSEQFSEWSERFAAKTGAEVMAQAKVHGLDAVISVLARKGGKDHFKSHHVSPAAFKAMTSIEKVMVLDAIGAAVSASLQHH